LNKSSVQQFFQILQRISIVRTGNIRAAFNGWKIFHQLKREGYPSLDNDDATDLADISIEQKQGIIKFILCVDIEGKTIDETVTVKASRSIFLTLFFQC
jgi:hypothetical protein